MAKPTKMHTSTKKTVKNQSGASKQKIGELLSKGETAAVDQQADDDLGVDPPLLGVTDLAQVVLPLGLEVQGGDVVQAQGQAYSDRKSVV